MPSMDYALYLLNTVKFNIAQLYHLFDEETFLEGLYEYYDPSSAQSSSIHQRLCQLITEIVHILMQIGIALRISLTQGLNWEVEKSTISPEQYLKFSTSMGAPVSIHDEDVTLSLPGPDYTLHKRRALSIHVRMSKLISTLLTKPFLPFDLECTYSCGFVLILISTFYSAYAGTEQKALEQDIHLSQRLLELMIERGSVTAKHRLAELSTLEELAILLESHHHQEQTHQRQQHARGLEQTQDEDIITTADSMLALANPSHGHPDPTSDHHHLQQQRQQQHSDLSSLSTTHDLFESIDNTLMGDLDLAPEGILEVAQLLEWSSNGNLVSGMSQSGEL
ncbi:hypothetical protein UA08_03116 [Talaromyces atroroseus]|uniref:Transcription factor domain-containing protein n=1 Tax=Talaromyces atroroseus TaxID=1441469 RepID=A0A225AUP3_TALAT|nr:hypothetical protein UA08_03116 [Talaromyces atroroseus]OKL61018.1 hypothetical protein UA08_03116 [Talaromyces atroroseus]